MAKQYFNLYEAIREWDTDTTNMGGGVLIYSWLVFPNSLEIGRK